MGEEEGVANASGERDEQVAKVALQKYGHAVGLHRDSNPHPQPPVVPVSPQHRVLRVHATLESRLREEEKGERGWRRT